MLFVTNVYIHYLHTYFDYSLIRLEFSNRNSVADTDTLINITPVKVQFYLSKYLFLYKNQNLKLQYMQTIVIKWK